MPDAKPPVFTGPKNDASMWLQAPVSADDFVRAAKKKSRFTARTVVITVGAVALVGVTAAGVWYGLLREPTIQSAALPSVGAAGSSSSEAPTTSSDEPSAASDAGVAEVAAAPIDASIDASVVAEAAAVTAVDALQVDAISAADPAVAKKKPTKKRPSKKKKVTKKKTAKRR